MSTTPPRTVAVVGAGRMGSAIAEAIRGAGFELRVYARTPAKARELVERGAVLAPTPAVAAADADVVITSLVDDRSVAEVVQGAHGILAGMRQGAVHVGATTVSPRFADEVAGWHSTHGSTYVAGPVVGRRDLAEARRLTTLAAGDPAAIEYCRPVLEAYGPIRVISERPSTANTVKLIVNFITVSWLELMSEMYAFGEKSGVDAHTVHDMLVWVFDRPGLRNYAAVMRDRNFDEAGFELSTGFKDVQLMLESATAARAPLPYADLIRSKMLTLLANDLADKDWAVIAEVARAAAGLDSLV
ncbi:MAG: NAD(P)-dependent oxidoreductase [Candidatus Dormibacteraeota bacterium]|nr:NAD(P)-dependent oxidoreductase [Candidatus Dormibacteraeota bacterium]